MPNKKYPQNMEVTEALSMSPDFLCWDKKLSMETKVILQRNIENYLKNFGVVSEDDHTLAPSPIASIENQQDQLTDMFPYDGPSTSGASNNVVSSSYMVENNSTQDDTQLFTWNNGQWIPLLNDNSTGETLNDSGQLSVGVKVISSSMKSRQRFQKKCPYCSFKTKYLSSHLKSHGLDTADIQEICKTKRFRRPPKKCKNCPMPQCKDALPFQRLDHHLRRFHKLQLNSPTYRQIIHSNTKETENFSDFAEEVCTKYGQHLQTLDGGGLSFRMARQHALKIRQMLSGAEIDCHNFLIENKYLISLQEWLKKYAVKNNPSSVMTYIADFISYCNYLAELHIFNSDQLTSLKIKLNKWRKSFRKLRYPKVSIVPIDPTEIQTFYDSEPYKLFKVTNQLINEGDFTKLRYGEFDYLHRMTTYRNVLILETLLHNACRSCVVANMQVHEFQNAQKVASNFCYYYVVYVANHKTNEIHGAAPLVLNQNLYDCYLNYLEHCRKCIVLHNQSDSRNVFLTSKGRAVESSDLYSGLKLIWKKAGLSTNIGSTLIRKTVTTVVHKEMPQYKDMVAQQLCHRLSTAESYYKQQQKSSQMVEASKIVENVLKGSHRDNAGSYGELECPINDETPYHDERNYSITEVKGGQKGRAFYSSAERELIKKVFSAYVNEGVVPKNDKIREIVAKNDNLLCGLTEKKKSCVKIRGCLQNFRNKYLKAAATNLDDEAVRSDYKRSGAFSSGIQISMNRNTATEYTDPFEV